MQTTTTIAGTDVPRYRDDRKATKNRECGRCCDQITVVKHGLHLRGCEQHHERDESPGNEQPPVRSCVGDPQKRKRRAETLALPSILQVVGDHSARKG